MKTQAIAVDIGNSGLRICPISLEDRTKYDVVRIDWSYDGSDDNTTSTRRFDPAGDRWLADLESHLDSQQKLGRIGNTLHWFVSSVRSDALAHLVGYVTARGDTLKLASWRDLPMQVQVDYPERVGIDRLLAAWAASKFMTTSRAIVIQAGSAVTVDLIEVSREHGLVFQGGAIVPGVPMMLRLLGRAADQLPELDASDLVDLPALPGKNTEAAMIAGVSSALVGGALHLVSRYRNAFGVDLPTIISGGDGPRLAPFLIEPLQVVPELVIRGLNLLARQCLTQRFDQ